MIASAEEQKRIIELSKVTLTHCYNILKNSSHDFEEIIESLCNENEKLIPFHLENRANYLTMILNTSSLNEFFMHF